MVITCGTLKASFTFTDVTAPIVYTILMIITSVQTRFTFVVIFAVLPGSTFARIQIRIWIRKLNYVESNFYVF